MTKKNPSVCHFAYKSLETTLLVSTFICTSCESFCVVHCAFLFNGFLFLCVFCLNLKPEMRSSKYGSKCGCLCVCMYLYACLHVMTKKGVLLFVYWCFCLFCFRFMGNMELASVCLHCLSVTGTYSHSPQCLKNKPTKQHHWSHSSEPPLSEQVDIFTWNLFSCFFLFLHCQLSALAEHLGIEIMGMKLLFVWFLRLGSWHNLMT